MEFSQLRTLIHVAELGSLSKAADRLHIAQPALSRQVRLLEEELGVRLFERHGRGMVLTREGQDVLAHADRIMAEMDEIRAAVADDSMSLRGQVTIGMPPTVSEIIAEPLVAAFRAQHPEATLRIQSAYSGHLMDWMHRGQLDVAVLYDPKSARTIHLSPLLEEQLFLLGLPGQGIYSDREVRFADLEGQRLVLPSRDHGLRHLLDTHAQDHGFALQVPVEIDNYATLKHLVWAGHGMTIMPVAAVHGDLTACKLCAAPIIDPVPRRKLVLGYPTDRPVPRLARFAGDVVAQTVRMMLEDGTWVGAPPEDPAPVMR